MTDWLNQAFKTIDRMDAEGFVGFLTDDAVFRYGSGEAVRGKDDVRSAVAGFFGSIKGLSHRLLETWNLGETVMCRGEVTYTRKDDKQMTLPFMDLFKMKGELVQEWLVYMDPGPLFAS